MEWGYFAILFLAMRSLVLQEIDDFDVPRILDLIPDNHSR